MPVVGVIVLGAPAPPSAESVTRAAFGFTLFGKVCRVHWVCGLVEGNRAYHRDTSEERRGIPKAACESP